MQQLINNATKNADRSAIISNDTSYTYSLLLEHSKAIAHYLLNGKTDLEEARVAFLITPSFEYTAVLWGIWRAGGIAVPLCEKHPLPSIAYVIEDTQAEILIYEKSFEALLHPLASKVSRFLSLDALPKTGGELFFTPAPSRRALILYTSGTTGNPKGVVTTHQNIEAQITSLTTSWEWSKEDHILNILPMHHVHGIINILMCALWSGACCTFLPKFSPEAVFSEFKKGRLTLFMAVPTIYFKLIAHWKLLSEIEKNEVSEALTKFRLMVSGSAALPISVLADWKTLSGHILLERYGMTEMGMAISNPYRGERKPGFIGLPLQGVRVQLADENNKPVMAGSQGEIQIKGPNVFLEYWGKAQATEEAFTTEGWFKTGDIAILEQGYYRILGRNSIDIIKSGGYKISALEIEEVLRQHPEIEECAVVGIPDDEWGELIAASIITQEPNFDLEKLTVWLKTKLPNYKIPRKYRLDHELPRNVMGKVTKNELKSKF